MDVDKSRASLEGCWESVDKLRSSISKPYQREWVRLTNWNQYIFSASSLGHITSRVSMAGSCKLLLNGFVYFLEFCIFRSKNVPLRNNPVTLTQFFMPVINCNFRKTWWTDWENFRCVDFGLKNDRFTHWV